MSVQVPTIRRMDANADTDSATTADHPLRMSGRGVFYSFSFDLGPGLDIARLADELLRKNMAAMAASPSRKDLRIPTRGVELDRSQKEAVNFAEFLKVMHSEDFAWRKLFDLNRRLTLRIAWVERKAFLRYYFRRAFFGQVHRDRSNSSAEESNLVPEWSATIQTDISEAIDGYTNRMLDDHFFGAIRLRLEQQLYLPGYFETVEPFIRIEMNRAYFWDKTYDDEPIEISLMAHRSGICMLTFAMPVAQEFGMAEAFEYLLSSSRPLTGVEVSVPVFGGKLKRVPSLVESEFYLSQQSHSGLEWVTARVPNDSSVAVSPETVFEIYLHAIQRISGRPYRYEWRCNTTLFLGPPRCGCQGEEAKSKHASEFAHLMVRAPLGRMPVQDRVREELLTNHLMNSNEELWLSAGHAIHISWNSKRIDYIKDLYMVEPIESAIIQHRQLQAIDNRTLHTRVRDKDLFAAQERLAIGLPEYGRNLMVDINAPLIVDALAKKLKTPDLYSRLNDRVKVLESIVNSRFTRKQSRRSLAISIIGIAIVVLLLLPRIAEFLNKARDLTPTRSLVTALSDIFGTADRATVTIYAVVVAITVMFFVLATIRIPRSRLRRQKRDFGFATRGGLELKRTAPSAPDGVTPEGDSRGTSQD